MKLDENVDQYKKGWRAQEMVISVVQDMNIMAIKIYFSYYLNLFKR